MNIIDKIKENNQLLQLQRDYEDGKILEEQLTEEQKEKLILLYKQQIKTINENIEVYNKKLDYYKDEIIKKRKKLNS